MFIRQLPNESLKAWLAHARARAVLIEAHSGPRGTMAWALPQLPLHQQQAERQVVPGEALS